MLFRSFVLSEFKANSRPLAGADKTPKPVKFTKATATFQQTGYAAANAIDGNPATGWAIDPNTGKDQAILFELMRPTGGPEGTAFAFVLDQ